MTSVPLSSPSTASSRMAWYLLPRTLLSRVNELDRNKRVTCSSEDVARKAIVPSTQDANDIHQYLLVLEGGIQQPVRICITNSVRHLVLVCIQSSGYSLESSSSVAKTPGIGAESEKAPDPIVRGVGALEHDSPGVGAANSIRAAAGVGVQIFDRVS
jgi:hypothetical protein